MADSAPYFHDGGSSTLEAAIRRHHGDAEVVLEAYLRLPANEQRAVIAFLHTLRAPQEAKPADSVSSGSLASAR